MDGNLSIKINVLESYTILANLYFLKIHFSEIIQLNFKGHFKKHYYQTHSLNFQIFKIILKKFEDNSAITNPTHKSSLKTESD